MPFLFLYLGQIREIKIGFDRRVSGPLSVAGHSPDAPNRGRHWVRKVGVTERTTTNFATGCVVNHRPVFP